MNVNRKTNCTWRVIRSTPSIESRVETLPSNRSNIPETRNCSLAGKARTWECHSHCGRILAVFSVEQLSFPENLRSESSTLESESDSRQPETYIDSRGRVQ